MIRGRWRYSINVGWEITYYYDQELIIEAPSLKAAEDYAYSCGRSTLAEMAAKKLEDTNALEFMGCSSISIGQVNLAYGDEEVDLVAEV